MNSENEQKLSQQIQRALRDQDSTNFLIDRACDQDENSRSFLIQLCKEIGKITDISVRDRCKNLLATRASDNWSLKENLVQITEILKNSADTANQTTTLGIAQDVIDKVEGMQCRPK